MDTTQPKKLLILNLLELLKQHTDAGHRLSQQEIAALLRREYGMKADRKTIRRSLLDLIEAGYDLEYTETTRTNRRGEEETLLTDWYLRHTFTDSELRLLINSLLLSSLGAFDQLAYNSIYPRLIPHGMEEKGYAVSAMLYPVILVVMTPLAAVLLEWVGVARILLFQSAFSFLAAAESRIRLREERRMDGGSFSFRLWRADIREAAQYLQKERGLQGIYAYMAVTNGVANGYATIWRRRGDVRRVYETADSPE